MLTDTTQASLTKGDVILTGAKGQYSVMALARVGPDVAWSVLTDYDSFPEFLPTITACRVVEKDGPRTIVEQVDRRRVLLTTVETLVRTENMEINEQQISFRLIEGNLKYMYGHWRLDVVDWSHNVSPEIISPNVLISQQVKAEADLGRPIKKMFYRLFEASLIETMGAIRDEMERRLGEGGVITPRRPL